MNYQIFYKSFKPDVFLKVLCNCSIIKVPLVCRCQFFFIKRLSSSSAPLEINENFVSISSRKTA